MPFFCLMKRPGGFCIRMVSTIFLASWIFSNLADAAYAFAFAWMRRLKFLLPMCRGPRPPLPQITSFGLGGSTAQLDDDIVLLLEIAAN